MVHLHTQTASPLLYLLAASKASFYSVRSRRFIPRPIYSYRMHPLITIIWPTYPLFLRFRNVISLEQFISGFTRTYIHVLCINYLQLNSRAFHTLFSCFWNSAVCCLVIIYTVYLASHDHLSRTLIESSNIIKSSGSNSSRDPSGRCFQYSYG